jgi:hypothetical protein
MPIKPHDTVPDGDHEKLSQVSGRRKPIAVTPFFNPPKSVLAYLAFIASARRKYKRFFAPILPRTAGAG